MPDVAVIGGGIIGLSTALNLARAGSSVTLLEARGLAAMASGWTLGGVRQSGRDPAELPLARAAVEMWQTLGENLDGDVEYRQRGNLRLARTEAEVETIRSMVASQADLGLKLDLLLGNAAVRAVAPALAPTVLAASFCPTDGHANPVKTAHCLAAAARRAGAVIREGAAVEHIVTSGGRVTGVATADGIVSADRVVIAAGVHAPELLAPLRVDLPMQPMIVSVLQTVPVPSAFEQVFGVANADCAGRQEVDGRLRITTGIGGWPNRLAGWRQDDLQPDGRTVAEMIRRVGAVLPIVETAGVAAGVGRSDRPHPRCTAGDRCARGGRGAGNRRRLLRPRLRHRPDGRPAGGRACTWPADLAAARRFPRRQVPRTAGGAGGIDVARLRLLRCSIPRAVSF